MSVLRAPTDEIFFLLVVYDALALQMLCRLEFVHYIGLLNVPGHLEIMYMVLAFQSVQHRVGLGRMDHGPKV